MITGSSGDSSVLGQYNVKLGHHAFTKIEVTNAGEEQVYVEGSIFPTNLTTIVRVDGSVVVDALGVMTYPTESRTSLDGCITIGESIDFSYGFGSFETAYSYSYSVFNESSAFSNSSNSSMHSSSERRLRTPLYHSSASSHESVSYTHLTLTKTPYV